MITSNFNPFLFTLNVFKTLHLKKNYHYLAKYRTKNGNPILNPN